MKTWYLSKTLWLNAISVLALLLQTQVGFVIAPEAQAGLLALINLILRAITNSAIDWSHPVNSDLPPSPPAAAGYIRLSLLPWLVLVAVIALGSLSGCATTTATGGAGSSATAGDTPLTLAGKSLLACKSTIVTAAVAVDALCKAHTIDTATCAQAKDAYELAKPAWDSAIDAYLLWSLGHGDQASFNAALNRAQSLANNLLTLSGGIK